MKRIISIFLIILLTFTVVGCNKNNPEDTVESYLNAIKNGDVENLEQYVVEEDDDNNLELSEIDEDDKIKKAFSKAYSKLEYEVLNVETNGDKAKVETRIKAPNLGEVMSATLAEILPGVFEDAFEESFSENPEETFDETALKKQMIDVFAKNINKDDISLVENTVKIDLVKEDDKWLIKVDENLENGLTGNLIEALKSFEGMD